MASRLEFTTVSVWFGLLITVGKKKKKSVLTKPLFLFNSVSPR